KIEVRTANTLLFYDRRLGRWDQVRARLHEVLRETRARCQPAQGVILSDARRRFCKSERIPSRLQQSDCAGRFGNSAKILRRQQVEHSLLRQLLGTDPDV